jgi:hypothetical protein
VFKPAGCAQPPRGPGPTTSPGLTPLSQAIRA